MDEQRPLTEEELLAAAEAAFVQKEGPLPSPEEVEEFSYETKQEDSVSSVPETVALEAEEPQEAQATSKVTAFSTLFTVLGIAAGLVIGAAMGIVTTYVPACLIGGTLIGLLLGLLLDTKKDKKANQPTVSILEEPAEETETDE